MCVCVYIYREREKESVGAFAGVPVQRPAHCTVGKAARLGTENGSSQGQNLALTRVFVPSSLDSGMPPCSVTGLYPQI